MSKRSAIGEVNEEDRSKPVKISKHSLDSDEEDYTDETEHTRLRDADIDGQENATVEYDEDIKITPFNMREELEEDGYFDGAGNFVFKKTTDARDNWLEDVNWAEVNRQQKIKQPINTAISDDPPEVPLSKDAKLALYKELSQLLGPRETVLQAIKRMGTGSNGQRPASASQRWLKKKQKQQAPSSEQGDPEGLVRATELADQLLQAGEFDVYQMSTKDIELLLQQTAEHAEYDELEALGQKLDDKDKGRNETNLKDDAINKHLTSDVDSDPTMWHLKRSEAVTATYEGPYSTKQLKQWVAEGKFSEEKFVLVRQVDKPSGQFYNINRIDFDLYE